MKRIIGLLMVVGMMVGVGCGGDSDSPTGPTKGPQGQTLEVETERWDNGNIKVEFQFYRDGGFITKHGWYREYWQNGQMSYEDIRVDGVRHGKANSYHDNGNLYSVITFVDGKKEGKWVLYDEEGNLIDENCYKNNESVDMSLCE